jgi:hypothetical protein
MLGEFMAKLNELTDDALYQYTQSCLFFRTLFFGIGIGALLCVAASFLFDGGYITLVGVCVWLVAEICSIVVKVKFKKALEQMKTRTVILTAYIDGMKAQQRNDGDDPFVEEWEGRL